MMHSRETRKLFSFCWYLHSFKWVLFLVIHLGYELYMERFHEKDRECMLCLVSLYMMSTH